MAGQMLKTWAICLIIAITLGSLANPSFGGPVPASQEIPKTTLDVLLQKFPSLDKSKLDVKLVGILNKTCADWQAINSTNSVTKEGDTNAQCLVLYESVASFCSNLGDSLPKYLDYIPTLVLKDMKFTTQNICSGDQSLYSLKDVEHNISNILQPATKPMNCYLLCGSFEEKGVPIIHDTCKYSYFFASFEGAKLMADLNSRLSSTTFLTTQNKTEPPLAKADVPESALAENEAAVQKPKNTVKDEANAHLDAAAQPQVLDENEKGANKASIKVEAPTKNVNPMDSPAKTAVDAAAENADAKPEKSDAVAKAPEETPDAEAEIPAAVAENPLGAEDEKNIPAPKDPNIKNEAQANAENNNSLEANANQDEMEDEEAEEAALAQEEANGKAEPVMPEENAEIKSPSIKGKPNTVEDEPVSSYNIPEDNMDGDSYFFSYFTVLMCLVIVGYVGYHNRQKILALVLEGKRGKRSGRHARRPNSSNYHKLDSNLEEAISSSCTKNASNVIY